MFASLQEKRGSEGLREQLSMKNTFGWFCTTFVFNIYQKKMNLDKMLIVSELN